MTKAKQNSILTLLTKTNRKLSYKVIFAQTGNLFEKLNNCTEFLAHF